MNSVNETNLAVIDDAVAKIIQTYRAGPKSALNALKKEGGAIQGDNFRVICIHKLANHKFNPRAPILSPWLNSQDLCMVYATGDIGSRCSFNLRERFTSPFKSQNFLGLVLR